MSEKVRIDKYLWAIRIFKTRSLAGDACDQGRVKLMGSSVKAARSVVVGDEYEIRAEGRKWVIKVTGLYDTTEAITINISAKKVNEYLEILVQNPFDPETSSPKTGTGFGLSSVQRRLYLLFARNDLLTTSVTGNIFSTTMKIPGNDTSNIDR